MRDFLGWPLFAYPLASPISSTEACELIPLASGSLRALESHLATSLLESIPAWDGMELQYGFLVTRDPGQPNHLLRQLPVY